MNADAEHRRIEFLLVDEVHDGAAARRDDPQAIETRAAARDGRFAETERAEHRLPGRLEHDTCADRPRIVDPLEERHAVPRAREEDGRRGPPAVPQPTISDVERAPRSRRAAHPREHRLDDELRLAVAVELTHRREREAEEGGGALVVGRAGGHVEAFALRDGGSQRRDLPRDRFTLPPFRRLLRVPRARGRASAP